MKSLRIDLVGVRSAIALVLVVAVTLSRFAPGANASSAAEMPLGATLTVLATPVDVLAGQTDAFGVATDGQMLGVGDIVRTGPGGLALLTFFDGSETQLGSDSKVELEQVAATPAPQIALLQTAGVTMNHVVPMPAGGTFRTDTPAATGLVRGTSYVVVVGDSTADGSASSSTGDGAATAELVCGANGGESCRTSVVLLTDRDGHVGRVDVGTRGTSSEAPMQLSHAGDGAAAHAGHTGGASVDVATLKLLEVAANARREPAAAREAEHQARVAASALAIMPDAQATPSDAPEDKSKGNPIGPTGGSLPAGGLAPGELKDEAEKARPVNTVGAGLASAPQLAHASESSQASESAHASTPMAPPALVVHAPNAPASTSETPPAAAAHSVAAVAPVLAVSKAVADGQVVDPPKADKADKSDKTDKPDKAVKAVEALVPDAKAPEIKPAKP